MKSYIFIILILVFFMPNSAFTQTRTFHSVQEVIDDDINEMKGIFKDYDNIFITTSLDTGLKFQRNIFKVDNGLNAKFLKKKDRNFVINLFIHNKENHLIIDVTNARVIKKSNKKLQLIYFENGQKYIIQ